MEGEPIGRLSDDEATRLRREIFDHIQPGDDLSIAGSQGRNSGTSKIGHMPVVGIVRSWIRQHSGNLAC